MAKEHFTKDPEFYENLNFTEPNQPYINENGQKRYRFIDPKPKEQYIAERTALKKKLARAGILFLIGIASVALLGNLRDMVDMDKTAGQTLGMLLAYGWAGCELAAVFLFVKTLHDPITKKDIYRYRKAIKKKMAKEGIEWSYESFFPPIEEGSGWTMQEPTDKPISSGSNDIRPDKGDNKVTLICGIIFLIVGLILCGISIGIFIARQKAHPDIIANLFSSPMVLILDYFAIFLTITGVYSLVRWRRRRGRTNDDRDHKPV